MATITHVGRRWLLRIDGVFAGAYDHVEYAELALNAYSGQEIH